MIEKQWRTDLSSKAKVSFTIFSCCVLDGKCFCHHDRLVCSLLQMSSSPWVAVVSWWQIYSSPWWLMYVSPWLAIVSSMAHVFSCISDVSSMANVSSTMAEWRLLHIIAFLLCHSMPVRSSQWLDGVCLPSNEKPISVKLSLHI